MNAFISFLIVLGVLVFFHELGHFVVARLFRVGVEKFSLGFGPRIFGKTIGITDYRISAIPLGGYVKMVGEEPDAEIDPKDIPISFTHKPVYQRMLIVAAGPVFNLFLSVFIFYAVFQVSGMPIYVPNVGDIEAGSPAEKSGFQTGDRILAINGIETAGWNDVTGMIKESNGALLEVMVQRNNQNLMLEVTPEQSDFKGILGEEVRQYDIGITLLTKAFIDGIEVDLPAQKAGLKEGDLVTAINDTPIQTWNQMADIITNCKGKPLSFKVLRDNGPVMINVMPVKLPTQNLMGQTEDRYRIGVALPEPEYFRKSMTPLEAVQKSLEQNYFIVKISILSVQKLIAGELSFKNTFGGPIMIAQAAGKVAKKGVSPFLKLIGWISISLAILNLLPIPVLDGGHLVFFAIEGIRGRPVSTRAREIAQQGGFAILLLLMIVVIYFDIARLFSG